MDLIPWSIVIPLRIFWTPWCRSRQIKKIKKAGVVLSFPRSGNHWTRFILEWFSGRPTMGVIDNPLNRPLCHAKFEDSAVLGHVNPALPPIAIKHHTVGGVSGLLDLNPHLAPLLLLIRNPLECLIRHNSGQLNADFILFESNLKFYRDFVGPKLIVYYEDLLESPEKQIPIILEAFGIDPGGRLNEFLHRLDFFEHQSRSASFGNWIGSVSGNDLTYHQKKGDQQDLNKINDWMKGLDSSLRPYIQRYL